MIYPPIKNLVEKTGNRYRLVVATAKRAREIAREENSAEKEKPNEMSVLEMRIKERMEKKPDKKMQKPIIRSLEEIMNDEVYIINSEEGYKSDNYDGKTVMEDAMGPEEVIMQEDELPEELDIDRDE